MEIHRKPFAQLLGSKTETTTTHVSSYVTVDQNIIRYYIIMTRYNALYYSACRTIR